MKVQRRRIASIAWPAFLMAGVLEIVVFAMVDPGALNGLGGLPSPLGAMTIYSIAFLVFWAIVAAACAMTLRLGESETEVNSRTFR